MSVKTQLAKRVVRRRFRVRNTIRRSANGRLRLSVFRSNKHIYAQIIDDLSGRTLAAVSSEKAEGASNKVATSAEVGKQIAQKALELGISSVVFDRSGYLYHGRVKSLADGAREAGLKF